MSNFVLCKSLNTVSMLASSPSMWLIVSSYMIVLLIFISPSQTFARNHPQIHYCKRGFKGVGCLTLDNKHLIFYASFSNSGVRIYFANVVNLKCQIDDRIRKIMHIPNRSKRLATRKFGNISCKFNGLEYPFRETSMPEMVPPSADDSCYLEYISFLECLIPKEQRIEKRGRRGDWEHVTLVRNKSARNKTSAIAILKIARPFNVSAIEETTVARTVTLPTYGICNAPLRRWPPRTLLQPWFDHHITLGVSLIALHTCFIDSTQTPSWVLPYIQQGRVYVQDACPHGVDDRVRSTQIPAANWCVDRFGSQVDFVAVIDTDEYLAPKVDNVRLQLLKHGSGKVRGSGRGGGGSGGDKVMKGLALRNLYMGPCPAPEEYDFAHSDPTKLFTLEQVQLNTSYRGKLLYSTKFSHIVGTHSPFVINEEIAKEYAVLPTNEFVVKHYFCSKKNRALELGPEAPVEV